MAKAAAAATERIIESGSFDPSAVQTPAYMPLYKGIEQA